MVMGFVFILCAVVNAYTIVMRDGRRLEIPSQFVVTASTLTYEVAPVVQITLNICAIDIAATEKINSEPAGSFIRRAVTSTQASIETVKGAAARRTITNRDLEGSAARRRASELRYEKRRKELGLPSVEETRRQTAAESATLTTELRQTRAAERESEAHWRARAATLRTDIATVDAELQYVRTQLDQPLFPNTTGSFATVFSVAPFGGFSGFGRRGFPAAPHRYGNRPGIFLAPNTSGRVGFGGTLTQGRVFANPLQVQSRRPIGGPILASPSWPAFGLSPSYDFSYGRNALITRFNELSATRAGLNARWRELEDEARRAGAPPGWLRK